MKKDERFLNWVSCSYDMNHADVYETEVITRERDYLPTVIIIGIIILAILF